MWLNEMQMRLNWKPALSEIKLHCKPHVRSTKCHKTFWLKIVLHWKEKREYSCCMYPLNLLSLNFVRVTVESQSFFAGHVNVLKWLNLKGDISLTDDLGGSPLHDAAEQGQFEVSKLYSLYGQSVKINCRTIQYKHHNS